MGDGRVSRAASGAGIVTALMLALACTPTEDEGRDAASTTGEADPTTSMGSDVTSTAADTGSTSTLASSTTDDADATGDPSSTGDPGCGPLPDPAPAWMMPLQQDVVARLSGAAELSPGLTLSDRASPAAREATRTFLQDELAAIGLEGTLHAYSETGTNLYTTIEATQATDRTLVVGAHFDSVPASPGANDNATGVAMVLSLARYLDALPCRELDVIAVWLDEEEIGLLGSAAFATWLTTQPVDVVSVHTIDQMGWDADGDRALELERADEGLFEIYEQAEPLAPGVTPLQPTDTGFTDHVSFRALGFAAIGLTEEFVSGDTTPHYHLPSDTFDTVDLDYLASSTTLLHVAIGRTVAPDARGP